MDSNSFKIFSTNYLFRDHTYSEYVCIYGWMYVQDLALINQKSRLKSSRLYRVSIQNWY